MDELSGRLTTREMQEWAVWFQIKAEQAEKARKNADRQNKQRGAV